MTGARAVLKVVDGGGEGPAVGGLIDYAMEPLPDDATETILVRADALARRTVELMRVQKDGATLASVAMVIGDKRLKLAFLEAIGEYLV